MNNQATPMDRLYASSDDEANTRPVYRPGDDALPFSRNVRGAALDLMILTYAAARHARWLAEIGACPQDIAEQIRHHIEQIRTVVESNVESSPVSPHGGPCARGGVKGGRGTPAPRNATRRNVRETTATASSLFNSRSQESRRKPAEAEHERRSGMCP